MIQTAKKKTQVILMRGRVLVQPVEADDATPGGIVLPDAAKEKPLEGEVIAVGRGKHLLPSGKRYAPEMSVGDRVLYGRYAGGTEIKVDDETMTIMDQDDILAVVVRKGE